jgi:bromodomain-containing factor 1
MDFSTVEQKLASSNPTKPDPNLSNPRYYSADEFIADVRLVFSNTLKFNGPKHAVTAMGKRLEEVFEKQIKNIPPAEVVCPFLTKNTFLVSMSSHLEASETSRCQESHATSSPTSRNKESGASQTVRFRSGHQGRPKREIHPPPSKDLPYSDAPRTNRKGKKVKDDGTAEQLKYCGTILQELRNIILLPVHFTNLLVRYHDLVALLVLLGLVDWQKMDLNYPKVVRKPMDLATIRKKLDNGEYPGPQNFYENFKLMIRNCFNFNPTGTPVNIAGSDLQRLFDEKWMNLPPLRADDSEEDEDEVEDSEEDDRQSTSNVFRHSVYADFLFDREDCFARK